MDKRIPLAARLLLALAATAVAAAIIAIALGIADTLQAALLDGSMVLAGASTLCAAFGRTDRYRLVWGALGLGQLLYAAGEINLDFIQDDLSVFPTPPTSSGSPTTRLS